MKKYLVVWLILSLLFPYFTFAYELNDKDRSIVSSATAKVEKMIQARWESMRGRIIILLEKAVSKYPNNARLQALVGKTVENIRVSNDIDLGDLFGEKNGQVTSTGSIVHAEEKKPIVQTKIQNPAIPQITVSTGVTYVPPVVVPSVPVVINVPVIKSCYIQNGTGQEVSGSCSVKSCNNWYSISSNSCIQNQLTCSSGQHVENNACISDTKSCTYSNWAGHQTWVVDTWWAGWGFCSVTSCDSGYEFNGGTCVQNIICSSTEHKEWNVCVSNTKSCTVSNGIGQQSWNNTSALSYQQYWNNCVVTSCDSGYLTSGKSCVPCWDTVTAGGFAYTTKLFWPTEKCWTSQNMKHIPNTGVYLMSGNEMFYDDRVATQSNICSILGVWWSVPRSEDFSNFTGFWVGGRWWSSSYVGWIISSYGRSDNGNSEYAPPWSYPIAGRYSIICIKN